ncbi:MAG: hypothetical protein FWG90_09390 [Oscillospiraceae bacterium]|nr:hypothetical protein [Oscillospiraceae bacterium]
MKERKYSVVVSPYSYDKLYNHTRFLDRISGNVSERFYDEFSKSRKTLEENPETYPIYEPKKQMRKNLRYKLFYKSRYRIIFEIVGSEVHIYDIQDCRQDTAQNLI